MFIILFHLNLPDPAKAALADAIQEGEVVFLDDYLLLKLVWRVCFVLAVSHSTLLVSLLVNNYILFVKFSF